MSKKDFEMVAAVLRDHVADVDARRALAEQFAARFAQVNKRFRPDVFMAACGVAISPEDAAALEADLLG